MFIFYVSLTLYKLFGDCPAENSGVFSDTCYFCNVSVCGTRCVAGERRGCLCPHQVVCYHGGALFTESYYSSFGVSVAPGQRASGTLGCWRGPWRRWDPWLTEWPVVVGVAGGVGGTGGVRVVRGVWWDNPRLLVWPGASVGPVVDSVACGRRCGPRLSVGPVLCGTASGCRRHLRWSVGLEVLAGAHGRRWLARWQLAGSLAAPSPRRPGPLPPGPVEIFQLCFRKCPSRLLCSPRHGGRTEPATSAFTQTLPWRLPASVGSRPLPPCRPRPPPRESAFL